MAVVQIADIYEPLTFRAGVDEAAIERNAFLASGVMVPDAEIQDQVGSGGKIGEVSYFGPLGTDEPNYTTDNPAVNSTPKKITDKKDIFRLANMHQSWSTMDLARELALKDPLGSILGRIGGYWATQIEKRVIQSCMGVLADNVANDSGDMVYDIATDDAGAITDAERISGDAVISAKQTMGDHAEALSTIALHSVVFSRLQRQELIVYERVAGTNIMFPTYLGYRVVVDDSLPAVSGTNRITYTSILFANGAIGNAQGRVLMPSEMEREPSAGNGGGQDIVHSRRAEVIHPYGFQFLSASIAGQSPTLAELADATEWDRVVDRKLVGIAFLQTNG